MDSAMTRPPFEGTDSAALARIEQVVQQPQRHQQHCPDNDTQRPGDANDQPATTKGGTPVIPVCPPKNCMLPNR